MLKCNIFHFQLKDGEKNTKNERNFAEMQRRSSFANGMNYMLKGRAHICKCDLHMIYVANVNRVNLSTGHHH